MLEEGGVDRDPRDVIDHHPHVISSFLHGAMERVPKRGRGSMEGCWDVASERAASPLSLPSSLSPSLSLSLPLSLCLSLPLSLSHRLC